MGSQTLEQGLQAMSGRSVVFPLGAPGIKGIGAREAASHSTAPRMAPWRTAGLCQ